MNRRKGNDRVEIVKQLSVLLVEDNDTHAHLVQRHLKKGRLSKFVVQCVGTLADAITRANTGKFDAVLLDLSLPDSEIKETLGRFIESVPPYPTIVLTSLDDLDFASELVHQGADDFLVKSDINSQILLRSIRYAIERRKSREALAEYAAKLERSNEELRSFAHTVAHEVRSPLNIVSCCLTLIDEDHHDVLGPDSIEAMEDATTAIKGMTELVTDLLEYSRVDNTDVEHLPVDLNEVAQEAVDSLKQEISESSATIEMATLPIVSGNAIQLRQLFCNLLSNAIKYRHLQRDPIINVTATDVDSEWQISFSDNGLGMSSVDQKQVFDPFVRAHESTGIPGTGIGLSFCRRIIENHGGKIWVESIPGEGSEFCFTILKEE